MDIFTIDDFKSLAAVSQNSCVSMYLQMHAKGKETRQNAIRLKNVLGTVKEALRTQDHDTSRVQEQLEPFAALLDDGAFWRNQSKGLALYASSETARVYRLPLTFENLQVVAGRFHLAPVLPLINDNLRFYILAISQNSAQFYRCDRLHIEPLDVPNMPKSIDDALGYDLEQRQFQFYTGAPVARGTNRRAAVFHGQGAAADEQNDRLLRYCRAIDNAVYDILRNETAPLVLAGVEKLATIYREATGYPNLMESVVTGNPEHTPPAELHRQAWPLAAAELEARRQSTIEKYNRYKGTGLSAADVATIVRCAFEGRIDRLILGANQHQWGHFDDNGRHVEIHSGSTRAPNAVDLLDVAACETMLKGGEVWTIDPAQVPDQASAVATLRF